MVETKLVSEEHTAHDDEWTKDLFEYSMLRSIAKQFSHATQSVRSHKNTVTTLCKLP